MKKDVVFSPDALTDLEGIKEYISVVLSNSAAAQRIIEKVLGEAAERLSGNPEIGPRVSSRFGINTEYRYLVVENYLVIYLNRDDSVRIIRVFDGRQDYLHMLFPVSSH